jgi:hypothetical protein
MTRRHKRNSGPRGLFWPVMIIGGILVIAAAFLLLNRGAGGSTAGSGTGTPQIAVDQQKIDYGYVAFGNDKQFTIKVTNKGDGALRFKQKPYIEILEGC